MAIIEMAIDSIRVSMRNDQRVVILKEKEGERYLPITIGPTEANAIQIRMQNVAVPRPLTHDVLCAVIETFGGKVSMAIISELHKDSFYAKLVLAVNDKRLEIDCRPSDAIAVAVRAKAPIFAEKSVLGKAGVLIDTKGNPYEREPIVGEPSEEQPGKLEMFSVVAQLVLALSEEDAKRSGSDYVETKHLLLALSQQIDGVAARVLDGLGVELKKVQPAAWSSITEYNDGGLSVNVKKAMRLAVDEVKRLNDPSVGTEHLLLGLTREGEGNAAKVLESLGVYPEKILAELLRFYKRGFYYE